MDSSNPIPRINGEIMPMFVNRRVRLVGKIASIGNGQIMLQTCDGRDVTVQSLGGPAPGTAFAEFEGTVTSANSLQEETRTDFGDDFGAPKRVFNSSICFGGLDCRTNGYLRTWNALFCNRCRQCIRPSFLYPSGRAAANHAWQYVPVTRNVR